MVRQALLRFVAAGAVVLAVVLVGGWFAAVRAAEREAVDDALHRTVTLAHAVLEPTLTDAIVRRAPAAVEAVDEVVSTHVLGADVLRVKLWTPDGLVLYSDEPALIGQRYTLPAQEQEALATGKPAAKITNLAKPENRYDRGFGPLLEVYLPVHTPSGQVLLFETYQPKSTVSARSREVLAGFAPILLGGVVLTFALLVPVAASLAHRLEAAQAERGKLLDRALDAAATERRRIAAHLHDGVVQPLVDSSFTLGEIAGRLGAAEQHEAAEAVRAAATEMRDRVRGLRSLVRESYPPSPPRGGLARALRDLTVPLTGRGIVVETELAEAMNLPANAEAALFRVAQEALRNVVAHADAQRVRLHLAVADGSATFAVADDGRGFVVLDRDLPASGPPDGRLGLTLLADALRELGGTLVVDSAPGRGTVVTAVVPAASAS